MKRLIVHRSRPWLASGLLAVALLTAACGPAAPAASPTAPPKPTAAAAPAAAPTTAAKPTAAAQSAPAAASGAVGKPADWDATLAAAKREGKVVVAGPPGELWRQAMAGFQEAYPDIRLEFTGFPSAELVPRVTKEYEAGQHLWDVLVFGPRFELRDAKILQPIRPALMLPEVIDDSKWLGGIDSLFVDKDKQYILGWAAGAGPAGWVNRDLVPESELSATKDLVDPKFRGKIAMIDPRVAGAGSVFGTVLLAGHGEPYFRQLIGEQNVVVTTDGRQLAEWVVRGRYPIAIGASESEFVQFERQGLTFNAKAIEQGARSLTPGFGSIALFAEAPNSNAAKVFANWLLTQKAQQSISQTVANNSLRTDVPPGFPTEAPDAARMADYVRAQHEELLPVRDQVLAISKELIK